MYIHVKVVAGARTESFEKLDESHYAIAVREKAERNQANTRVLALLHKNFPEATRIHIVNGHHSPSKLIAIHT